MIKSFFKWSRFLETPGAPGPFAFRISAVGAFSCDKRSGFPSASTRAGYIQNRVINHLSNENRNDPGSARKEPVAVNVYRGRRPFVTRRLQTESRSIGRANNQEHWLGAPALCLPFHLSSSRH